MMESESKNNNSLPPLADDTKEARVIGAEPKIRTMQSDIAELLQEKKVEKKYTPPPIINKPIKTGAPPPLSSSATKYPQKPRTHYLYATIGIIAFLIIGGGAYYYLFFLSKTVQTDAVVVKPAITIPRSFVSMEKSRNLVVRAPDYSDFLQNLITIQSDREKDGTLKRIALITQDKNGNEQLSELAELLSAAEITLPSELKDIATNDFNFFLYYQANGARRGLIMPISNETRAFRAMFQGEKQFFKNWKNLYEANTQNTQKTLVFEDIGYRNIDIRRVELSAENDLGFYYGIFKPKKYLIVTTSFEAMKTVLERMFDAL